MSNKVTTKSRESNIELLRIISMLGVILLHYNNPLMGGAFKSVENGSINFYILYFLESLCACSVDLFILITGYFMCKSHRRNLMKPLQLLVQVEVFSLLTYGLQVVFDKRSISAKSIISSLIPTNYFVILYITLYFISLYVNKLLEQLNSRQRKRMVALLILFFSIWPTVVDLFGEIVGKEWMGLSTIGAYGSQWGYSIVNFILMYIIGACIRLDELCETSKGNKKKLLISLIICSSVLVMWAMINDYTGFFTERSAWEYCNPIVIMEAVLLFGLFKNITIRSNKIINEIAKGAFSVFLLHPFFIGKIQIERFVLLHPVIMLLHIIISTMSIYGVCWMVNNIYEGLMKPIYIMLVNKVHFLKNDIVL